MTSSKDIRSQFKLEFSAPGVEKATKQVDKINKALSPQKMGGGMSQLEKLTRRNMKQMAALQKQVEGLAKTFTNLDKVVTKLSKSTGKKTFGTADTVIKQRVVDRPPPRLPRGPMHGPPLPPGWRPRSGGPSQPPSHQQDPSFLRGVFQGAGMGDYYPQQQRSGMYRQVAGNVVGKGLRYGAGHAAQMGSGLAHMPFSGLSGLQTAAAGIPVVGGIVAGTLQQGQAATQRALGYQASKIPLGGFMGQRGFADMGRAASESDAARKRVMGQSLSSFSVNAAPEAAELGRRGEAIALRSEQIQARSAGLGRGLGTRTGGVTAGAPEIAAQELADLQDTFKGAEKDFNKAVVTKQEKARAEAAEKAASEAFAKFDPFAKMAKMGVGFGKNAEETNQYALGLMKRGGGTLPGLMNDSGGLLEKALQTSTVFGTGPETAGAFFAGQQRGGIRGKGTAGENLEQTLKDAIAAGMDNAETAEFLEQIASAQAEFLRTGIPVNPSSIAQLAGAVGQATGVARGTNIASSLAGAVQNVGAKGPQDAMDFLMLQRVGKFGGGGLEDLEAAQERMQNMDKMAPEDFMDLIKAISGGSGGGASGRFALRSAFASKGASVNIEEARRLQALATGGTLSEEDAAFVKKQQAGMGGAFDLAGASERTMGMAGGIQTQKGIENLLTFSGQRLLPAMQDLEASQAHAVKALSEMSPSLKVLSQGALDVAKVLPELTRTLQEWMSHPPSMPHLPVGK